MTTLIFKTVFCFCALALIYVYAGYPVLVYLLGMILAVMLMWIGGAFASGGFFDQLLGGR